MSSSLATSTSDTETDTIANVQPILFPAGLIGCVDWQQFALLTDDEEDLPVAYLQSLDEPEVRLLVTDPRFIDDTYAVELSDEDRTNLDLSSDDNAVTYCTLTVTTEGQITANLLGPLVINSRTRIGRQLVLSDSGYSTRHPVAQLEAA